MRTLIALALVAAQWVPVASLNAMNQARLFLRSHAGTAPQGDELAELNKENPEAYALVKALLTKRSLGLLNPSHPTASFAAPSADKQQLSADEQGPEVFAKFASPGELQHASHVQSAAPEVAMPYAEVATAGHHDIGLNWKPNQAESDDQMVANVLGAVAQLKGGKKAGLLSKHRGSSESALSADESSFGVEAEAPAPPAQPVAAPRENSYLKTVDFGVGTPEAMPVEKPAPKHENSYLAGLDLSGDMPVSVAAPAATATKKTSQVQQGNALEAFSWDDSAPKEQPKAVKQTAIKSNGHDNALLGWLGVVEKAPAPKVAAPAPPTNPYLMDLS